MNILFWLSLLLYVQLDFNIENKDDNETLQLPCIFNNILRQLANLCVQVEDVFGSPQDIEWAAIEVNTYVLRT